MTVKTTANVRQALRARYACTDRVCTGLLRGAGEHQYLILQSRKRRPREAGHQDHQDHAGHYLWGSPLTARLAERLPQAAA